jgi:geranylgeranyl reductase family protein
VLRPKERGLLKAAFPGKFMASESEARFDVIVVGGGPGGSSAAYFHSKAGRKVALFDQAQFPRDKICGDGVTGKSLGVLHEMGLGDEIAQVKQIDCSSCLISSPGGVELTIPIHSPEDPMTAFCVEREIFDEKVFRRAASSVEANGGSVIRKKVKQVVHEGGRIVGVEDSNGSLFYASELVIGAGGYNCPVSRFILKEANVPQQDKGHYSAAVREYWAGISSPSGALEIHFLEGIQPGYFWIFPVGKDKYNIGLGMLLKDMDKQKVKLNTMLDWVVKESPLAERFSGAERIGSTRKGWLLPLGGKMIRKAHYPGAVLVGDAASLVDPFTGEGIGNALVSGKLSAELQGPEYQTKLTSLIGDELANSARLQRMLKRPWLVNWFFKKAAKKQELQDILTDMLHNKEQQRKFKSKFFWLKALFF